MITKEEIFKELRDRNNKYANVKGLINSFTNNNEDKIKQFRLLSRLANDSLNKIKNFVYDEKTSLEDVEEISPYISVIDLERQKYFDELTNLGYQVKEVGECLNCKGKFYNAVYVVETEEEIKKIKYCGDSCQNFKNKGKINTGIIKLNENKKIFNIAVVIIAFILVISWQYLSINSISKKLKLDLNKL